MTFPFFALKSSSLFCVFSASPLFSIGLNDAISGIWVICRIICHWSMALMSGSEHRTATTALITDSFPTFQCTGMITWPAGEIIRRDRCGMHTSRVCVYCFIVLLSYFQWMICCTQQMWCACRCFLRYFQTMYNKLPSVSAKLYIKFQLLKLASMIAKVIIVSHRIIWSWYTDRW